MRTLSRNCHSLLLLAGLPLFVLPLAGCGSEEAAPVAGAPVHIQGNVHGGQQPVSGATIQVWAAGTTGDGSASTALLTTPVTTDINGSFNLTGLYSCAANAEVYITATGGNPGLSGGAVNPQLALMLAPGTCGQLQAMSFITINELTTVAAVAELAPYMNDYQHIGNDSTDAADLAAAVADAALLVDPATGQAGVDALPTGASINVSLINTLGNALAACVNSGGGTAGDASACGKLFSNATIEVTGAPTPYYPVSVPIETIGAMLNMTLAPTQNVTALFNNIPTVSPFQPQLMTAPSSWSLQVTRPGLVFSQSNVDLGITATNCCVTGYLSFTNSSTAPISWSASLSANSDPNMVFRSSCTSPIAAGATCSGSSYVQMSGGDQVSRGTVVLTNLATNAVYKQHVRGWTTALWVDPTYNYIVSDVSAGIYIFAENGGYGAGSGSTAIKITNSTSHTIAFTHLVTGTGFGSSGSCPATLAPAASCNLTVSYTGTGAQGGLYLTDTTDNQVIALGLNVRFVE